MPQYYMYTLVSHVTFPFIQPRPRATQRTAHTDSLTAHIPSLQRWNRLFAAFTEGLADSDGWSGFADASSCRKPSVRAISYPIPYFKVLGSTDLSRLATKVTFESPVLAGTERRLTRVRSSTAVFGCHVLAMGLRLSLDPWR